MPTAAIDIGSNSLLLLIVDDEDRVLHDEATVVGLGRGLGDRGLFLPDRMERAEATLAAYVTTAREHGIAPSRIRAVATSASRRALNAETWFSRLRKTLGLSVTVISGDEEARLTWLGAMRDLPAVEEPLLVIDLGGGSTELALGTRQAVERRTSLPVGSVRLTEQFFSGGGPVERAALRHCRSWIDVSLQRFPFTDSGPQTALGVAGTVTTLAAMVAGLTVYDSDVVHASVLTRDNLLDIIEQLLPLNDAERSAAVPSAPARAPYLIAGATVLDRVLAASSRDHLVVSDRGLRYGIVHP